jgi:hypothetical protein
MTPQQQYKIFWEKFVFYFNAFNLARWELYECGISKDDKECLKSGGAKVTCDLIQKTCEVRFYPFKNPKLKKSELENCAMHEALHVLLFPLGKNIPLHHEIINILIARFGNREDK